MSHKKRLLPTVRMITTGVVAALLLTALAGCGPTFGPSKSAEYAPPPMDDYADSGAMRSEVAAEAVSDAGAADGITGAEIGEAPTPPADRKIIVTGDMTIEVANVDKAMQALTALVEKQGGFFASRQIRQTAEWRQANVVIRVPAENFWELHKGARTLGLVRLDNQQGEDVTEQWIDLEARIRIRKAEEKKLIELMERQGDLTALLKVEQRLWEVREAIEKAEGSLRFLKDRVALATLSIELSEKSPLGVEAAGPWDLAYHVGRAWQATIATMQGLLRLLIYLLVPGILFWGPVVLFIIWVRRRLRRIRSAADDNGAGSE